MPDTGVSGKHTDLLTRLYQRLEKRIRVLGYRFAPDLAGSLLALGEERHEVEISSQEVVEMFTLGHDPAGFFKDGQGAFFLFYNLSSTIVRPNGLSGEGGLLLDRAMEKLLLPCNLLSL